MTFRSAAIFVVKRVIPVILLILLALFFLGLLFFDSIAQTAFKDATAQVPGDLRVRRFSPTLRGLSLEGVQWNLDSKEPVFEASEIDLTLDYGALSRGDWYTAIEKAIVRKPGLRVTVDQNGNVNLLSLLPATQDAPVVDLSAVRTEVEFQNGWILYNDRRDAGFLYELSDWSGRLSLADGETVQFMTSGNPDGNDASLFELNGEVALGAPELVAQINLQDIDLEPFTGFPGFGPGLTYVRGMVNGSVRASGTGENWTELLAGLFMVGEVTLDDGAFRAPAMPASFTELMGSAELLGSGVSTDKFQGRFADIGFELVGRSELGADGSVEGRINTERFPIEKLNSLVEDEIPIQGEARAEVAARGRLENLLLTGTLYGYDLVAQDQKVSTARADFLKTDEMIYLPQITAATSAGDMTGEGWVFLGDEIRVLFEMDGKDTRPDVVLPGIAQRADFTVKVLGDPGKPMVYGQGALSGLGDWAQGLAEAEGKFVFSGEDLLLYGGRASAGSSVVNLDVGAYDLQTQQFSGLLSALNFRAEDLPGLSGVSGVFTGQAMVEADLSGDTPKVQAQAVLSEGRFQTGDLAVTEARGQMYFDGAQVVIPWATSNFRGSPVELSGVYDTRNTGLSFAVKSPNFDLSSVGLNGERADLAATLKGRMDGNVGLYGVASSARGKAAVSGIRRESGRVSAVAWVDGAYQGVDVETTVVADGTPDRLSLEYTGELDGAEFAAFGPVGLFGAAELVGDSLRIRPTLLAGPEARTDTSIFPLTTYSGAAYSFFGPLMSGPLEKVVIEESPFPTTRSLIVAGNADLGSGALDLNYHLRAAQLEDAPFPWLMENRIPFELLSGYGQMNGRVLGTLGDPKVEANFHFPWLMLAHQNESRLSLGVQGRLELGKRILTVPQLTVAEDPYDARLRASNVTAGDGLLGVTGVLRTDQTFDVRLRTEGFSPSVLAFFAPQQFAQFIPSGRLATESLHLWGSLTAPSIAGQVRLLRGGMMLAGEPYPINSAFIDISSQGGEIRVRELGLTAPGVNVTGALKRRTGGQLEGEIRADDIDLSRLHRFQGAISGLDGTADVVMKLGGSFPGSPLVEFGFRASDLTWNPRAIGGKDQVVPIETLVLGVFEEDRLASGLTLAPSDSGIYFEIPAGGFLFRRAADGLAVSASGAVDLPTLGAEFKTFRSFSEYFASPQGPDFGRQGVPFQLRVSNLTTLEGSKLLGRPTRGVSLATGFNLSLEGQWWRDHKVDAGDSLPNYSLAFDQLTFESSEKDHRSGFGLNNPARLTYRRQGTAGFLNVKDVSVGFFREETPAEAKEKKDSEESEPQTVRQGSVNAEGSLAVTRVAGTEPESRFTVDGSNIPLENLAFLLPDLPLTGLVDSMKARLVGVLPTPDLNLDIQVSDFGLGPVANMKIDGSVTAFKADDDSYRIVVGEEVDKGISVTFADDDVTAHGAKIDGEADLIWVRDSEPNPGRLELFAKNLSVSLESPLRLTASLIDKELAVLASIVPGQVTSSGDLSGTLTATGTLRRPEFEGKATLQDGRFDSKKYGRFEQLNLDAELTRITREEATDSPVLRSASSGFLTRFNLNRFGGTLGGAHFFGGGIAEFAGIVPTLLDLHLAGDSLPIRLPDLFVGQADVHLELNGKVVTRSGEAQLRPQLTGLLVFPQGEFKIPLSSVSSNSTDTEGVAGVPLDVNVDVNLGSDFFVSALNSRVRTVGDLQLRAIDSVAKVYGRVALSRGTIRIPFYDASFRVRQGLAIFDGPLVPRLEEVEAVADLGGYRVTARANGRYPDTFSLDLYSVPPLPQAELSRIAVLGGLPPAVTGSQLDPNQRESALGTLGNTGVSFLSGVLTNRLTEKIGNLLFLSELSFDYIPPATYAIKIAKSLDPNDKFLLTVTRIIRDNGLNENLFGIEWRLTRQFLLRTAFDQFARARFWVQSINRF